MLLNSKTFSPLTHTSMEPITIAFRVLLASLRGTEVALYDYAVANEEILGNRSIILIQTRCSDHNQQIITKFRRRFHVYFYSNVLDIERVLLSYKCKVLYTIAYGERRVNDPTLSINNIYKTALHCVFSMADPHADTYVPISQYLANNSKSALSKSAPFVPHIISLNIEPQKLPEFISKGSKFKEKMGIPMSAIVFGRHGGYDTFNIPFVHDVVASIVGMHKNIYFVFVNTNKFINHPQVKFLAPMIDDIAKITFIMACDAMLHARADGETFGIACGEFSVCNKPVITCVCGDTAHIDILGRRCITYTNSNELQYILTNFLNIKIEREKELNKTESFGVQSFKTESLWDAYSHIYSAENVIKMWWKYLIEPCL